MIDLERGQKLPNSLIVLTYILANDHIKEVFHMVENVIPQQFRE